MSKREIGSGNLDHASGAGTATVVFLSDDPLLRRFRILVPDLDTAWGYGQRYRYLKDNGLLIGANDLWIAATAIVHGLPLVTRNPSHFRRVPGLSVVTY